MRQSFCRGGAPECAYTDWQMPDPAVRHIAERH
jgi:hypothetical protein